MLSHRAESRRFTTEWRGPDADHRNALWRPPAEHVEFPASEILGPGATEDEIQGLIDRHKLIFIKPLFRGGIGKKGKAGLIGKATDLKTALKEKEPRHANA